MIKKFVIFYQKENYIAFKYHYFSIKYYKAIANYYFLYFKLTKCDKILICLSRGIICFLYMSYPSFCYFSYSVQLDILSKKR